MPTHRIVILGLIAAFILVVAVDYWRKRHMPKTRMVFDSREDSDDEMPPS